MALLQECRFDPGAMTEEAKRVLYGQDRRQD
jgi:hypothetical protein